ncbi:MAG: peptidoglycan-binding protein [Candidatus Paceibacterota bacterium]
MIKISSFLIAAVAVTSLFLSGSVASAQNAGSVCYAQTTRALTVGSVGAEVVALQRVLIANGYLVIPPGAALGYFGLVTRDAVAKFQMDNAIVPAAGYVGPLTQQKLSERYPCGLSGGGQTIVNPSPGCAGNASFSALNGQSCLFLNTYDYTSDGSLNADDTKYLLEVVVGSKTCPTGRTCDVDRNGTVTAADTLALGRYTGTDTKVPSIHVTYPNGGETFLLGKDTSDFRINWTASNLTGTASLYLNLADGGTCLLGKAPVSAGTYLVAIGTNYRCPNIPVAIGAGQYKVLIATDTPDPSGSQAGVNDKSDNYFTLVVNPTGGDAPSLTVTSPNGGEMWNIGETRNIRWTSHGAAATGYGVQIGIVDTRYSTEVGARGEATIANLARNTGGYSWTIPASVGSMLLSDTAQAVYKIVVHSLSDSVTGVALADFSNAPFSIVAPAVEVPSTTVGTLDYVGTTGAAIDHKVDQADVQFLLNLAVQTNPVCPNGRVCDLTGDGKVTASDALKLGKYVGNASVSGQYDYDNNAILTTSDTDILRQVAVGSLACPTGKVCDIDGVNGVNSSDARVLMRYVGTGTVLGAAVRACAPGDLYSALTGARCAAQ